MTEDRPQKIQKLFHEPFSSSLGDSSAIELTDDQTLSGALPQGLAEESQKYSGNGQGEEVISSKDAEQKFLSPSEHVNDKSTEVALSKSQLKKLRKQEEWEAGRDDRKAVRKEKTAQQKARKREAKAELARVNATQNGPLAPTLPAPGGRRRPVLVPITFVIDCGFDNYMIEKERISLGLQLTRSYSDNHRAPFQAHLVISSWGGLLKERFDTLLEKHHENWRGVTFVEGDFTEAARIATNRMLSTRGGKLAGALSSGPDVQQTQTSSSNFKSIPDTPPQSKENSIDVAVSLAENQHGDQLHEAVEEPNGHKPNPDLTHSTTSAPPPNQQPPILSESTTTNTPPQTKIVYLTSDSPHTLTHLSPHTAYIIGGIVDKNRHKGLCYRRACDRGVATAKLPISEYMAMQSRSVLATNHVVEIMLRWLECGDWGEAFVKVIPKRKGGVLRGKKGEAEEKGDGRLGGDEADGHENRDEDDIEHGNGLQMEDEATEAALEQPE